MKKRIILASIILALIPLAIRAIGQPKYSLLEANVEALLTPETGGEVVKCYCKTHCSLLMYVPPMQMEHIAEVTHAAITTEIVDNRNIPKSSLLEIRRLLLIIKALT